MKRAPLNEKNYLNPQETIELFGLSRRKFYALLKEQPHDFVVMYGSRKLIIRTEFEKYLKQAGRKEALKSGEVGRRKKTGLEA